MAVLIQKYRGRVVDAPGDNLLAEFSSLADAVKYARDIHQMVNERKFSLLP